MVTDNALESQGVWSAEQQSLHINVRELYVAFICLTIFCPEMSEVHVCFHLDNSTAVNQMGGMKSLACDTAIERDIEALKSPLFSAISFKVTIM